MWALNQLLMRSWTQDKFCVVFKPLGRTKFSQTTRNIGSWTCSTLPDRHFNLINPHDDYEISRNSITNVSTKDRFTLLWAHFLVSPVGRTLDRWYQDVLDKLCSGCKKYEPDCLLRSPAIRWMLLLSSQLHIDCFPKMGSILGSLEIKRNCLLQRWIMVEK